MSSMHFQWIDADTGSHPLARGGYGSVCGCDWGYGCQSYYWFLVLTASTAAVLELSGMAITMSFVSIVCWDIHCGLFD